MVCGWRWRCETKVQGEKTIFSSPPFLVQTLFNSIMN
ncbi:hypothetical protein T4B_5304 [Trichinella pseudospiralis]|uniref:Uncharacterized protein n=1 Tax=Trichinella pseudospiralis TaxID=6337 RepID=A0A0V1GG83_TRIPS|nr:hypothetical protein T4B_14361 [Trichinella pseudospiralis]KRY98334.1 hypothetical protein T4B_5304 [Trichinella pseudospiralis]